MFGHDRKLKVREERLGVWSVIGVKGGGSLKCSNILYTILLEKKKKKILLLLLYFFLFIIIISLFIIIIL